MRPLKPLALALLLALVPSGGAPALAQPSSPSFEPIRMTANMSIQEHGGMIPGLYWEDRIIPVYEPASGGVWYPRLLFTRKGTLLCAFDSNEDGGRSRIKLVTSLDEGLVFSESRTAAALEGLDCANPALVELADGSLLLAYRANAMREDGYYSSIRASVSHDGGATWEGHSLIAEEFGRGGVYEPHFGFIGERLAVFYANDSLNVVEEGSQQLILFKLLENGAWGEALIASDGVKNRSRDGMPVWTKMADGRYALVIEATNVPGHPFVIQMTISPDGLNWNEGNRDIYIPYMQGKKAGAPYILTLPDGRLAVAFQTDDEAARTGDGASYMKVIVSTDPGKEGASFSEPFIPFLMPEGHCANWNAMQVQGEVLYAVTSANYPRSGVYLRRAYLTPRARQGVNLLTNGDFRLRNNQGWSIIQSGRTYYAAFGAKRFEVDGDYTALTLLNLKPGPLELRQEIPGLMAGAYRFSLRVKGDGEKAITLRIEQGDQSAEFSFVPGQEMKDAEITGISLRSGPARLRLIQAEGLREMSVTNLKLEWLGEEGAQ
jgi:hypothetical protein